MTDFLSKVLDPYYYQKKAQKADFPLFVPSKKQVKLLYMASKKPSITAKDGKNIYYDHSSFSRAIHPLIKNGYVEKSRNGNDIAKYSLSRKGHKLLGLL